MKSATLLILFLSVNSVFSQEFGIEIGLTNGDTVKTNYIMFKNYWSYGKPPYIRVDDKKGRIIQINKVRQVVGFDENGDFRFVKPIKPLGFKYSYFGERVFRSERVTLYQTNFDKDQQSPFDYREKHMYYSLDDSRVKELDYKLLTKDIGDYQPSMEFLKAGRNIHKTQLGLYVIGYASVAYSLAKIFIDIEKDPDTGRETAGDINVPMMVTGAVMVNVAFFLTPAKKRKYAKALEAYK